jgi:tetratricopeptide (TPR) repeat protein
MSQITKFLSTGQLLLMALLFGYNCNVWAEANQGQSSAELIELAAIMLKDGHSDRALLALQSIDLENEKIDLSRFYTLQGLAYMNLNDFVAAKNSLQLAIDNGQLEKTIYVYLAQVNFSLKNYPETIQAIINAAQVVNNYPSLFVIKARAHWHLKETANAIKTLNEAEQLFPDDYRFLKQKVFYFVELALYQEAAKLGREYLALSQAKAEDYIAIGNALRLSKAYDEAMNILEIARLQFPTNDVIAKLLAHVYLDQDKLNSAAFILEQAALWNTDLLAEAAEVYRRAGRFHKALTLNQAVSDQKVKFKQRLSILLALKQYEQAANMESSLYRTSLLEDQHVRYALAYALFSTGRYSAADEHIDHLKDAELFRRGMELRRLMEICKTEPWQCA